MRSIFLTCPVEALMQGIYQARTTMSELKRHGGFGIGTFNNLDGEMIVLDGDVYRADAKGRMHTVEDNVQTPFACVTHFNPDTSETISTPVPKDAFWKFLEKLVPSENMAYAFLIKGIFELVHARSVPAQKDSRPLIEVTRNQTEFEFLNIKGVLLGFYTPSFIKSLVIPGFHLHFVDDQFNVGGHLLNCSLINAEIQVQHIPQIRVGLPMTLDFLTADLSGDVQDDIKEAES